MPGSPDFQGYTNWRAIAQAPVSALYNPGSTLVFQGVTTNYNGIYLSAAATAGNGTLVVQWFSDTGATILLASQSFNFFGTNTLDVILPVLGNSVQVSVLVQPANTLSIGITIQSVNTQAVKPTYVKTPGVDAALGQTINATSVKDFRITEIAAGMATLFVNPGTAGAAVIVTVIGYTAVGTVAAELAIAPSMAGAQHINFQVPAMSIAVRFNNTSGGASTGVEYALTVISQ